MSRPARLAALSVLVLFFGCRSAHAAGWWDFLEALSGPGPFTGYTHYFANVYCAGQKAALESVSKFGTKIAPEARGLKPGLLGRVTNGSLITGQTDPCFYFDFSSLDADADNRFPEVHATFYEVGLEYRLLSTLDLGAGFGGLHLTAKPVGQPTVGTDALMLTPVRLTMMPLYAVPRLRSQTWAGFVKVYFRQSLLVGTLDGHDFGVPPEVFREESEFVRSFGIVLDLTKAIRF